MKKVCTTFALLFLFHQHLSAQFSDSLSVSIGTTVTAASEDYQPLWIVANRFGTIQNRQADLSSHIRITNRHDVGKLVYLTPDTAIHNFTLRYGIDLYNNNRFNETFFKEAFVKFAYRNLEFRAGRYAEVTGEIDPKLSSGSLGVSSNAVPVPQIGLTLQYVNVPFTKGWVQFKGTFSHGWFGEDNYAKNSYLHQKSAYLQFGKKALRFHAGLNHFVQWGGTIPQGQLPNRFKDFLRIIAARSGRGGDYVYQQGPGSYDTANGVGNHIIIPDFGLNYTKGTNTIRLYAQNIFDKGQADSANQRDRLDGLRIFGKDRLVGLTWRTGESKLLNAVTVEYIYTKHQGGPVQFFGRDEYYNNATYLDGWLYRDRIIGTPLFIARNDAEKYEDLSLTSMPMDRESVTSNRISGFHVGLQGAISTKLKYRFLSTHLSHAGNYYNDDLFLPKRKQTHLLLETEWQFLENVSASVSLGHDFGDIYTTTGGRLCFDWRLF